MTRSIAYFLIIFVLFTHSTMAMDVHIPHDSGFHVDEPAEHLAHTSKLDHSQLQTNPSEAACADASGHCSHHQAHASGLVCVNPLSYSGVKSVLFSQFKQSAFLYTQTPPRRPPKA